MQHIPVLAKEVLHWLNPQPGQSFIDATLGLGGHAKLILEAIGPEGQLIGFDRDARNVAIAKENLKAFEQQIRFIHESFGEMDQYDLPMVHGVLFDLGFSSAHVDDPERGFSFRHDGPLDMRYDQQQAVSAETIINGWSKDELAKLFRQLGEEPFAAKITNAIFHARRKMRITTTRQLADIVATAKPGNPKRHPATQVFQALRIAVNNEFEEIEKGLTSAVHLLQPGGRIAVLSFHSIEDRMIKNFFKGAPDLEVLTKKPVQPHYLEVKSNKRARSAKLRVVQKTEYDKKGEAQLETD
jgi:16S rRNA (cytosine1402-N4)-methyltransferase